MENKNSMENTDDKNYRQNQEKRIELPQWIQILKKSLEESKNDASK